MNLSTRPIIFVLFFLSVSAASADHTKFVNEQIQKLKSKDLSQRYSGAGKLGRVRAVIAVPDLIFVLRNDIAPGVRMRAAQSLGVIGDERALKPLILALNDKSAFVINATIIALGELGSTTSGNNASEIARALAIHYWQSNFATQSLIIKSLAEVNSPEALESLILIKKKSKNINLRTKAKEAIKRKKQNMRGSRS